MRFRIAGLLLVSFLVHGAATGEEPLIVGETAELRIETSHPYPKGDPAGPVVWSETLHHPDATYLALHLERVELAPGDYLSILDSGGKEQARLTGYGPAGRGTGWSPAVDDSTLVLELHAFGEGEDTQRYGLSIDSYAHGFLPLDGTAGDGPLDEVCGTDERRDARCYIDSHPLEYDRARAVGRLLINGTGVCTGWLVSCQGHMITNNHCVSSQSGVENTQVRMMYERTGCGTGTNTYERTVNGQTLIRTSGPLDYTLFTIAEDVAEYGFLGLDPRLPDPGERLYMPAHHGGGVRKFGIESDNEPEGVCRFTESPWTMGSSDILYYCDTSGGSSGSPVLSGITDRVVALNHTSTNDCHYGNQGVRIDLIFPEIRDDLPACSFSPDLLLGAVEVLDGAGNGNGFPDPGETLRLRVTLDNRGISPATGVSGNLSTGSGKVMIVDGNASFDDVPDGGSGASLDPHFEIRLSRAIPCGERVSFALDVSTDQGVFPMELLLEVGENLGGARSYAAQDLPLAIPDENPDGIQSILEVSDSFPVDDAFVRPEIEHTYAGDLIVELTSPSATVVRLHDHTGWSRDGLDDDYDREVLPDGPGAMGDFDGENSLGTWTLKVIDENFFDTGTLTAWTLELHEEDLFTCDPVGGPPTPGEASAAPGYLTVTNYDDATGDVTVAYAPACQANDHAVYSGDLAQVASLSWDGAACSLGSNGEASFDPGEGSRFFVVVGQDGSREGSYGRNSNDAERPEAAGFGACDLPQELFDACED